jgi:hypothetical protein
MRQRIARHLTLAFLALFATAILGQDRLPAPFQTSIHAIVGVAHKILGNHARARLAR